MMPHVRNYYKHFGYDESDHLACELCGLPANDLHHVEPRSSFGSTRKDEQDAVTNLIALCRYHHDCAHGQYSRNWKIKFKQIIANR
jgi:hypothetical protein